LFAENKQWMEFKSISGQLEALSKRVTNLEVEQLEQAKSLTFYGDEIQEIKRSLEKIKAEREAIKESSSSFSKLTKSLDKVEQERNLKTLIIAGVPTTKNENLFSLIELLSKKLDVPYASNDIDNRFRATAKSDSSRPPIIIVKYNSMYARDALYDGRKQMVKKNVTTNTLGIEGKDSNIFINEQLSKQESDLFYRVRQRKKDLSYKYAWTFHGHVFMRKDKASDAVRIKSEDDLIDLKC
jgi:DNA repair exonuclease SbcCD ATPase subunit